MTLSRILWQLLASCAVVVALTSCNDSAPVPVKREQCTFRTGDLRRSFCRISIYQLLANPETRYGQPIFTYGFIQVGPNGSLGLAPSPDSFQANDTIGCVQIASHVLGPRESKDALAKDGVYAAQVAGDFSQPVHGICSGRLSNATVINVRLVGE